MPIKSYGICYIMDDYNNSGLFWYMYKRLLSKYDRYQLHNILNEIINEYGGLFGRAMAIFILFQSEYPNELKKRWKQK